MSISAAGPTGGHETYSDLDGDALSPQELAELEERPVETADFGIERLCRICSIYTIYQHYIQYMIII